MAGRGRRMAKVTLHRLAKPDHPVYNRPIMIGTRLMTGKSIPTGSNIPYVKNLTADPEAAGTETEAVNSDEPARS